MHPPKPNQTACPAPRIKGSGYSRSDGREAQDEKLPIELLILYRFGVRYFHLNAAWNLSKKYNIPPSEILISAGIITKQIWTEAQTLLIREKARTRRNYKIRNSLLTRAVAGLRDHKPEFSAYRTITRGQVIAFALAFCISVLFLATQITTTIAAIVFTLTPFYTLNILSRGMLLATFDESISTTTNVIPAEENELPNYSILVALYQESSQVRDLAQHLWQLDWPKEKLDIKFICEADDLETIAAIVDLQLPPAFDLVLVPPAIPRTKPRALNYALPLAHGKYLVLYDAEDRPARNQLKEAHSKFTGSKPELACLQAPLRIHNPDQSWLSKMFAIEYLTLFNGILPVLAKWKVPLPLGGTSNHFKTDVLRKIGAWDPYNVTEDADLGIRLYREGYTTETISAPTYEEAPPVLGPWMKQRTRWIKGWLQTILVHNRNPITLFRDMGLRNGMAFHLFFTSIVLSALIHPVFILVLGYQLYSFTATVQGFNVLLMATSTFNLVGGYTTYGLLALIVLKATGNKRFSLYVLTLPLYWVLISCAGWRALVHLVVSPHRWEKTPHGLASHKFGHSLGSGPTN